MSWMRSAASSQRDAFLGDVNVSARVRTGLQPFQRHLLRALIDGSTAAGSIYSTRW
jgi:hypothetical protein